MTNDRAALWGGVPRKVIIAAVAVAALVLMLLYLQGTIGGHKIAPGTVPMPSTAGVAAAAATVERREVEDIVDWPGTVRSRTVAGIAPKVMARVLDVRVTAGTLVKQGDVLAVLDDRDVRARVEQARAALAAVEAQARQADADVRRARTLFQKQASTQQDLDAAEARAKATRAQVAQARDAVAEAEVMLGETTVRAPFDGVVAERLVDPGDTITPGRTVVSMHDPQSLRLEADVGERCAAGLAVGRDVAVRFETLGREIPARIEVMAPAADPQTRTFLVKAALPAEPDLRPGIFGTLRVACGSHMALLVPPTAVTRTGQLETVRVLVDGEPRVRHVRTGKVYGDRLEVLSGLQEGERVMVEADAGVRRGPRPDPPPLPEVATGEGTLFRSPRAGGATAERPVVSSPVSTAAKGGGLGRGLHLGA
jgi:RND family efflux transporter MFP subunit